MSQFGIELDIAVMMHSNKKKIGAEDTPTGSTKRGQKLKNHTLRDISHPQEAHFNPHFHLTLDINLEIFIIDTPSSVALI